MWLNSCTKTLRMPSGICLRIRPPNHFHRRPFSPSIFVSPNIYFCKVVWLVKFRDDSAKQFFQHFCKVYGWRTWILCSIFVAEVMRVEVSLAVVVSLRPEKGRLWASRFHPTQFRVGHTWCGKKEGTYTLEKHYVHVCLTLSGFAAV